MNQEKDVFLLGLGKKSFVDFFADIGNPPSLLKNNGYTRFGPKKMFVLMPKFLKVHTNLFYLI
jgi:hypothetical protein